MYEYIEVYFSFFVEFYHCEVRNLVAQSSSEGVGEPWMLSLVGVKFSGVLAFANANHLVGDGLGGYVERIGLAGCYCERAGEACLGNVGYVGACLGRTVDGVGDFAIVGDGGVEIARCGKGVSSYGDGVVLVEGGEAGVEGHCDGGVLGGAEIDGDGLGFADAEGELGGSALIPGCSVLRRGTGGGEGVGAGGDDGTAVGEGQGLVGDGVAVDVGATEGVGEVGRIACGTAGDFGEYLHVLEVEHDASGRDIVVKTSDVIVLTSGEGACGQKDGCQKALYRASSFHYVWVKVPPSVPSLDGTELKKEE